MSDIIDVGGQGEQDLRAELALLRADINRLSKDLSHFVESPRGAALTFGSDLENRVRQHPLTTVLLEAATGYWVLKPWTALALGAVYFARQAAPVLPGRHRRTTRSDRPSWEYWSGR